MSPLTKITHIMPLIALRKHAHGVGRRTSSTCVQLAGLIPLR